MSVFVSSLNLAAIYGLVAIGLSLTWAGLRFLNLAHGVTFAAAGYAAFWTAQHLSSHAAPVILAGVLLGAIAGAIIWLVVFLPLDGRANWDVRSITATLALSLIGVNALLEVFGPYAQSLPRIFGSDRFRIGGTVITADRSGTIVGAVVVLGLVVLAISRTRAGLAVRALTQNVEGARLVGIDRRTMALAILAVSGALAGLASVLLSQTFYVESGAGYLPLVKGMIVALLGGLGSISGTAIAALLIGATEALTARYLDQSYVLMLDFAVIMIVLLIRPRGIGGILETARA